MRVALIIFLAFGAHAGEPKELKAELTPRVKAAWQWTDEERLARRFDAASVQERAARDARDSGEGPRLRPSSSNPKDIANVINGRYNPELFMPHELFIQLMFSSVVEERHSSYRDIVADQLAAITNRDDFWRKLEAAAAPYTALLESEQRVARQLNTATADERKRLFEEIEKVQEPQCAARAEALRAAIASIGKETLYRVLYEVVAPSMATRASAAPSDAERIRFVAGGCR